MPEFQIGSISTGTLRPEDLLPVFADAAESLCGDMAVRAVSTARIYLEPDAIVEDEQMQTCLEELRCLLDDACPPFIYFGSLPGDGADFGFWVDTETLGDALQDGPADEPPTEGWDWDLGEYTLANHSVIVQVFGHGDAIAMDMERNVLWSLV